jgi:hypothetical protein
MVETTSEAAVARNDLAVKMGADVVKMAKVVALNRNITLAEYLTERIRPFVEADYERALAEMAREVKSQRPKGRRRAGPTEGDAGT